MKLYEITGNMRELQAMVDSGEMTLEMINDTMSGLEISFDLKVEACLRVRQELMGDAVKAQAEIDRLTTLKGSAQKEAEKLTEYVKSNMQLLKLGKVNAGLFKASLRTPSKKIGDVDESKIPSKFFTIVPESRKLDKRALLSAAKNKPIDGVQLIDGNVNLIVK